MDRLVAVENLLAYYAEGPRPVHGAPADRLLKLGMLGTSTLRRLLRRSDYSVQYKAEMGGVVALVGSLVDLTAALTKFSFEPTGSDQKRLRDLATIVRTIRSGLMDRRIPHSVQFDPRDEALHRVPLLWEMENIVSLIPQAFTDSQSMEPADDTRRSKLIAPDALVNSDHLKFALRGCFSASACYFIYHSIAWPAIGAPAIATCVLTALSTIGASLQRQVVRVAGFVVGGLFIGMGSQVFILPYVDSIAGFTTLFKVVIALASWFLTSSPRLSYFGLQLAVVFCLINLQGFAIQTSLSAARDRVVGVCLGLLMIWLAFDRLWTAPVGVEMRNTFISNLRQLAQFAREPLSTDLRVAAQRSDSLRETINNSFDQVRALADGVLFELGPSRQQDLALRSRIRRWQPQLRTLFVIRTTLLKYLLQLPGFELPEAVRLAQQQFDNESAKILEGMANRLDGKPPQGDDKFEDSFKQLQQVVRSCCSGEAQESPTTNLQTFLALSRNTAALTMSLSKEI